MKTPNFDANGYASALDLKIIWTRFPQSKQLIIVQNIVFTQIYAVTYPVIFK